MKIPIFNDTSCGLEGIRCPNENWDGHCEAFDKPAKARCDECIKQFVHDMQWTRKVPKETGHYPVLVRNQQQFSFVYCSIALVEGLSRLSVVRPGHEAEYLDELMGQELNAWDSSIEYWGAKIELPAMTVIRHEEAGENTER